MAATAAWPFAVKSMSLAAAPAEATADAEAT